MPNPQQMINVNIYTDNISISAYHTYYKNYIFLFILIIFYYIIIIINLIYINFIFLNIILILLLNMNNIYI